MSTQEKKKRSLLAPVIGAYEPTDADADRIFAKVEATLDAAPSSRPAAPASALSGARGRTFVTASLSCVAVAVVAGMALRTADDASSPSRSGPEASGGSVVVEATDAPRANEAPQAPDEHAADEPTIPLVEVDTLPTLATAPEASQPSKPPAARTPSSLRAPAPDTDTLAEEARLLADARRASQAGAGEHALALLDEHASTFPKGWLEGEREAERVLVLCHLGRRAEATRAAAVFLEGRPKGPLTRRVEMSCAGPPHQEVTER